MRTTATQELIEKAYDEFKRDDTQLSRDIWDNLDNNNISPSGLWAAFEAGFIPVDIYINQEIING